MTTFLFTYGTLRPGGALDDLTDGIHYVGQAVIHGELYRHRNARFPVLVLDPDNLDDLVTGDLFAYEDDDLERLDFVTDMEVGAGYDVRVRPVMVTRLATGQRVVGDGIRHAVTFGWQRHRGLGPRIHCGDWLSLEARDVCNDLNAGAGFTVRR